jgi:hypothetical protein
VKRLNPDAQVQGQGELFSTYRYHCAFTDSPLPLVDAEKDHRRHAIVEQVIADVKSGPLAHLPSGDFQANAAWLALAAITHNLMRALGTLASAFHARATTSTLRDQLICVPARIARGARRLTLHLPRNWPWRDAWQQMFAVLHAPPHRWRPIHPAREGPRPIHMWKSWADQQLPHAHRQPQRPETR